MIVVSSSSYNHLQMKFNFLHEVLLGRKKQETNHHTTNPKKENHKNHNTTCNNKNNRNQLGLDQHRRPVRAQVNIMSLPSRPGGLELVAMEDDVTAGRTGSHWVLLPLAAAGVGRQDGMAGPGRGRVRLRAMSLRYCRSSPSAGAGPAQARTPGWWRSSGHILFLQP